MINSKELILYKFGLENPNNLHRIEGAEIELNVVKEKLAKLRIRLPDGNYEYAWNGVIDTLLDRLGGDK